MPLSEKSCTACDGNIPPLSNTEIRKVLEELGNGWTVNAAGHLEKTYKFTNFKHAMDFANHIAIIAEQENHHPDILVSWGQCKVEIWTHKINGLTENDFILAAKIEEIQITSQTAQAT